MKPTLLALSLLLLIAYSASAQSSVSGTIKDSTNNKPIQFATVELFKSSDTTKPVRSGYTSDNGKFAFSGIDTANYLLIVSHTSYEEITQTVPVGKEPVALNNLLLTPASANLAGVVVRSRKPLVEQSDDKIVFNVENDPAAKTETAIDILRKTPFVTVDGEDNITVNGQNNFKVLLNGRETAMFAQNVKEALKGFPGALITKIEVITTPSAKYDAEGVGGIINIITQKKVMGYNGSFNLHYNHIGWFNINSSISAKYGKFGFALNYGAGGGNDIPGRSKIETLPLVQAPFTRRLLLGERSFSNFWNFGNAELSYSLDSLNTLSLYGNISGGNNENISNQEITTFFTGGTTTKSLYDLNSRYEYPTKSVGLDYIRKYNSNKDKEFSIRFNNEFGNTNAFIHSEMDNENGIDRHVINKSIANNKQYTLQSDYVMPFKKSRKLELGAKGIWRRAYSDFESFIRNNKDEEYQVNEDNTDYFQYRQDVYSAYSSYGFKVKKTSFRVGARVEHTEVNGDFRSSHTKVNQAYTNLLPNVQATTKLGDAFTLVLTYSDRLQRPYIYNLNPFRNNNDSLYVFQGNPDLDPQVVHSLSAQTRFSKGKTFAGITLTGSYSDNMIVQYATFDKTTGVTTTTSANLGEELSIGANGNLSLRPVDAWTISINGHIKFSRVKNKLLPSQVNTGYGGNANLNSSYRINKRFNVSGYAGFFRSPVSIQTSYPLNIWYGINGGHKFFKEKLTLSVGLANFFTKERDYKLRTVDPNFTYSSTSTMLFRGLSMSLSWNFGKLTENVSKKKGVSNDDLISNGNSGN